MNGFEVGQHLIIHTEEDVVAGFLLGTNDEMGGIMVRVTHKMKPVVHEISGAVSGAIVAELESFSTKKLRTMLALNRVRGWLSMDRDELISIAQMIVERKMLDGMPDNEVLTPMKSPINTFLNSGYIHAMEATDDRNQDAVLSSLDFRPSEDVE
jgi:hypothetical protein